MSILDRHTVTAGCQLRDCSCIPVEAKRIPARSTNNHIPIRSCAATRNWGNWIMVRAAGNFPSASLSNKLMSGHRWANARIHSIAGVLQQHSLFCPPHSDSAHRPPAPPPPSVGGPPHTPNRISEYKTNVYSLLCGAPIVTLQAHAVSTFFEIENFAVCMLFLEIVYLYLGPTKTLLLSTVSPSPTPPKGACGYNGCPFRFGNEA
ncbi:hypothetical protein EVAR_102245_1 [Eumeta japonica]|uniref:Uncharacterized protein n=1 Tax=Eumeta variegata TaxID=151549 RepID=A0A4C1WFL8_EUMVA|nr:hypothetical protein EVAR_102245_1 [Eumeta japonica]